MTEKQGIARKQLAVLFLCSLFVIMYAGPLIRLLPIHASQMGATSSQVGLYMALTYSGLVGGTLFAGWLNDKVQRKKTIIIVVGIIASLGLALMSLSTTLLQLSLSSLSTWFFGGTTFILFTILAGLSAGEDERGKVFGLLTISLPLASVIAAPVAGSVADQWGYPALLAGYALFSLVIPVMALLLENPAVPQNTQAKSGDAIDSTRWHWLNRGLSLLATATLIMAFVNFANGLGLSLAMHAVPYTSSQIANAAAVGALVSIPVIYLFGRLSDSYPRKWLLTVTYLLAAMGTLMLSMAGALWQFWLASSLVAILTAATSVGNALTADLLPTQLVGRGLAFTNSARWVGAVLGFALAGFAIDIMGIRTTYLVLLLLVPLSVLLVFRIRPEPERTSGHDVFGDEAEAVPTHR